MVKNALRRGRASGNDGCVALTGMPPTGSHAGRNRNRGRWVTQSVFPSLCCDAVKPDPSTLPVDLHERTDRAADPAAPRASRRRSWLGLAAAALAVIGIVAVFTFTELSWSDVHTTLQGLPAWLAIALMAVLPLTGFSVAVVYVVAGARFGPWLGGVVVAGITVVHLLGSYWIARGFLRGPLERFLARRQHALPHVTPQAHVFVAAMAALMPGLPYFVRNYLLPLSGIPLQTYFWICLPIYVVRSYVTLFLGDLSGDLSVQRVLILGAVLAAKLAICGLILARLRRQTWPLLEPASSGSAGVPSAPAP